MEESIYDNGCKEILFTCFVSKNMYFLIRNIMTTTIFISIINNFHVFSYINNIEDIYQKLNLGPVNYFEAQKKIWSLNKKMYYYKYYNNNIIILIIQFYFKI